MQVKLNWVTTNELNSDFFDVERSKDGIRFTAIGRVAAMNTATNNIYWWTDISPFNESSFYRLKIVDKDGSFTYSSIIRISISKDEFFILNSSDIKTQLIIEHPELSNEIIFYISDIQGKIVQKGLLKSGSRISLLNVNSLPPGVYLFVIKDTVNKVLKFIKH
jgi:hypothetical protein